MAKEQLNSDLEIDGVVLTMFDGRTNLARQVVNEARQFFGGLVFKTVIPRNIRLSECPSFGQPIFLYDPQSLGAAAYEALAMELEARRNEKVGGRIVEQLEATPAQSKQSPKRVANE